MRWLAELEAVLPFVEELVPKNSALVRRGERARAVYLVRSGGVKEVRTTSDDKDVIVALHGPGDLFGELTLEADGETAIATAITLVPSRLLVISHDRWRQALDAHPRLYRTLTDHLIGRLEESWRSMQMLSRYTTEARLKWALLLLAEHWGRPHPSGGTEIDIDITHKTLASLIGASREKVTISLGVLQEKGVIHVVRRRIILLSPNTENGTSPQSP